MDSCRPGIGTKCQHKSRPGEVCATYPIKGGFSVVGKYLDVDNDDSGQSHFICPSSECLQDLEAA